MVRQRLSDRGKAVDPRSFLSERLAGSGRAASAVAADKRVRDNLKARLLQDLTTYSLPSLLRYEDRNSMAHSIESRPPFLDQELVELVLALPSDAIVRDGWSRWILRESLSGVLPELVRTRRKKIGFTTPEIRWLRAQRAVVQGILRSPACCSRPFWDAPAIARAFRACCDGELEESPFFWRVLNAEAWLRVFHGAAPLAPAGVRPQKSIQRAGDETSVALLGAAAEEAAAVLAVAVPNAGRHLFACGPEGRKIWARVPVRTPRVQAGDDLEAVLISSLAAAGGGRLGVRPGDIVAISEKAVAISQGRSFPVSSVSAGFLARRLSSYVKRTPAGIGLGIPETMQLAIDEVGPKRILAASVAGAAARLVGVRGTFYRVAGPAVRAIDGPTSGTLPPYDTHAKLAPADPDGVATSLSERLSQDAGGTVEVAIVDANDRGVNVLGTSAPTPRATSLAELVAWLFGDNPLGQGTEQTPVALLRQVGELKG